MIYLWKLEGEELQLNLAELLKYPELAAVYVRDQMPGKVQAKREFRYIDFITNRDSFPIREGMSKEETRKFAVINSRMPKTYFADAVVEKAIARCFELNGGIVEGLIDSTVAAFRISARMVDKLKDMLETLEKTAKDADDVVQITKLTDVIINMSGSIPGKIDKLLELRSMYDAKLNKAKDEKRGGGEVSNSYDGTGIEQYQGTGEVERLD